LKLIAENNKGRQKTSFRLRMGRMAASAVHLPAGSAWRDAADLSDVTD